MTLLAATVLAAPIALPTLVHAQPVTGPYVSGGLGYNIESSQKGKNLTLNNVNQPDTVRITMHNGWTGEASVGYGFGDGFRAEVEGDYYANNFAKSNITGDKLPASGKEQKYGVFLNGLYDFDLGWPVFPYLGAGVGWQNSEFQNFSSQDIDVDKTRGAFAYQGIAGLAIPIPGAPGLSATVEYRFMALTGSRKYNGGFTGGGVHAAVPASFKMGDEYNNSIMVGLRYQLFTPQPVPPAPAPAPVAAPAPAPAQTYLVFFDWDRYNLTPRATQIIAQAADASHTQNVTTLNVSGYTDTSGTPRYNQGLSMRRAKAVAAQLVTDGVPQSEIQIHAYGETHLLVPTGPGVREPQNRRVEIVLQ
ncbi:OmpA family protein [Acidocella sp.]|uniref:OmpA family protein n=1 Tax=Acidocella sp. TaxID=50710 RepID=UPI002F3F294F